MLNSLATASRRAVSLQRRGDAEDQPDEHVDARRPRARSRASARSTCAGRSRPASRPSQLRAQLAEEFAVQRSEHDGVERGNTSRICPTCRSVRRSLAKHTSPTPPAAAAARNRCRRGSCRRTAGRRCRRTASGRSRCSVACGSRRTSSSKGWKYGGLRSATGTSSRSCCRISLLLDDHGLAVLLDERLRSASTLAEGIQPKSTKQRSVS